MKQTVGVSVVIPVYNAEKYLSQCLDSIINQTFQNIEIICVNNGSNDNSFKILEKYAKKDSRFHILNIPKSNAGTARNQGIATAKGEYLAFIDADDFCEPDMLKTVYSATKKHHPDIVVFEFYTFDDVAQIKSLKPTGISVNPTNTTFNPASIKSHLFKSFKNCPWNKLFRRDFIVNNNILFQEIPRSNDIYFTNISLALADKITILKKPLINYRINAQNSLQTNNASTPLSTWDAFKYLKTQLIAKNLYQTYEKSFLNELLVNVTYTLDKLPPNSDAYNYLFSAIRYGAEIEFNFSAHKPSYYNPEYYNRYLEIINTPSEEEKITQAVNSAVAQAVDKATRKLSNEITSAKAYKIGMAITKAPRTIKNLFTKGNHK